MWIHTHIGAIEEICDEGCAEVGRGTPCGGHPDLGHQWSSLGDIKHVTGLLKWVQGRHVVVTPAELPGWSETREGVC